MATCEELPEDQLPQLQPNAEHSACQMVAVSKTIICGDLAAFLDRIAIYTGLYHGMGLEYVEVVEATWVKVEPQGHVSLSCISSPEFKLVQACTMAWAWSMWRWWKLRG